MKPELSTAEVAELVEWLVLDRLAERGVVVFDGHLTPTGTAASYALGKLPEWFRDRFA